MTEQTQTTRYHQFVIVHDGVAADIWSGGTYMTTVASLEAARKWIDERSENEAPPD